MIIINVFTSNLISDFIYENDITKLDFKPLNCSKCLAVWLALPIIIFNSATTMVLIIGTSYMINKIINKY